MIFWIPYGLSFLLVWYEHKFLKFYYSLDKPIIFASSPAHEGMFLIVRLLILYGSLGGLLYVYGIRTVIVAFLVYFAFLLVTYGVYFNREVHRTALKFYEIDMEDEVIGDELRWWSINEKKEGQSPDEKQI